MLFKSLSGKCRNDISAMMSTSQQLSGRRLASTACLFFSCLLLAVSVSAAQAVQVDDDATELDYGRSSGTSAAQGPSKLIVSNASQAEKDLLLQVRAVQPRAVVDLNEALTTAQSIRRAQTYLAVWQNRKPPDELPQAAQLQALEKDLEDLQDRFLILYQAHFGNKYSPGIASAVRFRLKLKMQKDPGILKAGETVRMAQDPAARAQARAAFMQDVRNVHQRGGDLLATLREQLLALQRQAAAIPQIPGFEVAPAFGNKAPASILPDGTVTGIVMTVQGVYDHPGTDVLLADYTVGIYESYLKRPTDSTNKGAYQPYEAFDPDYRLDYMEGNILYGRKTQVIVPCARGPWTYCPPDWFEQDLHLSLGRADAAKHKNYSRQWGMSQRLWSLDIYHPAVRQMVEGYLQEVGALYKDNPDVLTYTTAWESSLSSAEAGDARYRYAHWPSGGRTEAGLVAFRKHLAKKFGSIEKLNSAWDSNYSGFDAIPFPTDAIKGTEAERKHLTDALYQGRTNPLYYEFHAFLLDSYTDYMASCYRTLKSADPNHPISASPSYGGMDGYLTVGVDAFRWADEVCDLFGSELTDSFQEVYTYSVQRASKRATGIFESVWNRPDNRSFPAETEVRAAGRANSWRMVAWGRTVISFFGIADTYGNNNMMILESNYNLLRIGAGIVPVLKRKLRSMEDVWLHAPVVEPQIAVLRSTASRICEWPWNVREFGYRHFHSLLYGHNYHYAFVPEKYLLNGREDLDEYKVLVLPFVTQLPPGLTEKILPWIKSGGTLIIGGVAGAYTPYGKPDGRLMSEVFGDFTYKRTGDLAWKITPASPKRSARNVDGSIGQVLEASYGKGHILMSGDAVDLAANRPAGKRILELLERKVSRLAWASGSPVEMVIRKSGDRLHLTLINGNLSGQAKATIHLAGFYRLAVDRGIERGFVVPLHKDNQGQTFDIAMAPGEGTMIEMIPQECD